LKCLRILGKGDKLEELVLNLAEDVQLLVNHDAVKSANRSQNAELEVIDELKSAISGLEESSSTMNSSNGDGPQTNNFRRGSGNQFDSSGGEQQYNAKTQNLGKNYLFHSFLLSHHTRREICSPNTLMNRGFASHIIVTRFN
jgi:hypothetical protein